MYVFTANAVLNDYLRVSGQCSRFIGKLWVGCWVDFFGWECLYPPVMFHFYFFSYGINLIVCLITYLINLLRTLENI